MPLGEGVLSVNLGIPIIVVCHKIDMMLRGEKAQFLETNIDFIQRHLRNYCLSYAASLVFTEIFQYTNIERLYRYVLHRLYDYELNFKAEVSTKEQIFIPTGFDSQTLINELCKDANSSQNFYERIQKPIGLNSQQKVDPQL